MREKLAYGLAALAALLLAYNLYNIFLVLPDEASQGPIYRILYFHAPAAIVGMIGFFVAMVCAVIYLWRGDLRFDAASAAINEVSLVFVILNVITGSIWARVIWGIWWTWDHRLTSALICVLIYAGYLMLRKAIDEPTQRARLSAALSIFGVVDVVIVWKSIEWWRTQHPGPVLSIRTGGGNMDPAMEHTFYMNFCALALLAIALILIRASQDTAQRKIDSLRRLAHSV